MTIRRFQGACDASAATRIAGTACFAAASDEDYILRVYDSHQAGPPVAQLDVTDFLEPIARTKEPDIEGAAQLEDRVYWIGSHGRDKDGVEQESRQRLFATEVTVIGGRPELLAVGKPYKNLLKDLSAAEDLADCGLTAAAKLPPEAPGGLNIEGLTTTPEGQLLVGFRNPTPQGRALIVRIHNPTEIVAGTSAAKVSRQALLDLGNRGVRAIESTLDGHYLILAGRFDDARDFALFAWDGSSSTPTQLRDGASLNELNPEELLVLPDASESVELFSDDGDMPVGDKKCKKVDVSARSFRVATINLTG